MKKLIEEQLKKVVKDLGYDENLVKIDNTNDPKFGDYTSNISLVLARPTKQSPETIAKQIEAVFGQKQGIDRLAVVNGFINFYLSNDFFYNYLDSLIKNSKFEYDLLGKDKSARVEYISANPTGPLHIGNARGGPIGETISRLLEKVGYKVLREYIHNDVGTQVDRLGQSILYWYEKEQGLSPAFPEAGYKGDYVREIAEKAVEKFGDTLSSAQDDNEAVKILAKYAVDQIHEQTVSTAKEIGIEFDYIQPESELLEKRTPKVLEYLKSKNLVKEQDGAVWFAPSDEFLKDRECVLVRSDGRPTYFANDISYHQLKFESKPDLVIDVFGSNHHGHVPRLQAAVSALGYEVSKFRVVLYQYVRVAKGDKFVKMAKREGDFVRAQEVLDEVGKDAFNFFLLWSSASTHMDFDLELAKKQSNDNPVYYVQYAHARCVSILKSVHTEGKARSDTQSDSVNYSVLKEEDEIELLKKIVRVPEVVESISQSLDLQVISHYAIGIAETFHRFYEKHRVINDNIELQRARLALTRGTQLALAELLTLLNVSAPTKM